MAFVYTLKRHSSKGHNQFIPDTDTIISRSIGADPNGLGGAADIWGDTDTKTTSIKIGTGSAVTGITIGGGASQTSITIGKLGQTTTFLGSITVNQSATINQDAVVKGRLYGDDDGTGLLVGKVGAVPFTGSTIQLESFTSAERDFLTITPGMFLYNSTRRLFQSANGIRWGDLASNNFDSVSDPTSGDDVSLGYDVGSRWINSMTQSEFVCMDNTLGAAVWAAQTGVISNVDFDVILTTITSEIVVANDGNVVTQ